MPLLFDTPFWCHSFAIFAISLYFIIIIYYTFAYAMLAAFIIDDIDTLILIEYWHIIDIDITHINTPLTLRYVIE